MKHIFLFFILYILLISTGVSATRTVMYDSNSNKITVPSNASFISGNKLVTSDVLCLFVDMFRGAESQQTAWRAQYFTELEVKVLDSDNNLLYHTSTVFNDMIKYHNDTFHDTHIKFKYYLSGVNSDGSVCAKKKMDFTPSYAAITATKPNNSSLEAKNNISLAAYNGYDGHASKGLSITAIEVYIDLDYVIPATKTGSPWNTTYNIGGESYKLNGKTNGLAIGKTLRQVFLNPNNTVVISRKTSIMHERDNANNRVWKAPTSILFYNSEFNPYK